MWSKPRYHKLKLTYSYLPNSPPPLKMNSATQR